MATQTGSIDLTASNGVKLMAEAGFENIEKNYATKAELDVQADRIGMVVANNDASSSLQLTADAMTYIGNNVTIKGTDGTTTAISGGRIQANSLSIGAFDSAAQSATLNSNISVGGRNLFLNSGSATLSGTANQNNSYTTDLTVSEFVPAGTEVTVSCQIDATNLAWGSSGNKRAGVEFNIGSSSYQYIGAWAGAALSESSNVVKVVTGTWSGRISKTVTLRYDLPKGRPYGVYVQMLGSGTCTVSKPKLEIGNKATDWSPAPEDVDSAVSDAAKTATSYVTDITGGGIMVHPSGNQLTGVRITSDVDILRNGYSVINVGTRGDTSGNTDSGVTIYDGSGDSPSNAVVTFTGEVDSAGRRRSHIDTGDPTDGSSAAEVIGTVEDTDHGSYVLRRREMELFAYAPNGTDSGSVSAWARTSTDGTFDESGVALYGKWLNLNHESTYTSVPMEQAAAMLSVDSATLTRGSGASSWTDGVVRRSGKVVTVTINGAKLASALASGSTSGSITTIPTGYRPSNLQRGTACLSTSGNYANVWFVVSTTGGVAIANRSSLQIPTTAEISLQITYVIA